MDSAGVKLEAGDCVGRATESDITSKKRQDRVTIMGINFESIGKKDDREWTIVVDLQ